MEEKEINLLDYIYVLVKWRKLIIWNFVVVCVVAAGFTLVMPQTFTAHTVIMPPTSSGGGISALLANLPISGLGGMDVSGEANTFLVILKSRTLMERVAKKFDLQTRYKKEDMEETVLALKEDLTKITLEDEGTISISAKAKTGYLPSENEKDDTRQLAAGMANFMVEELDRINKHLQTTQARYHREFIEKRYLENKSDLAQAEQHLKQFQETYNVIALPEQVQAAVSAAAELQAQITVAEVELGAMKSSLTPNHPEIQKKETEIRELKSALNQLQYGDTTEKMSLFPAFADAPELGIQYLQLRRELEVQNKIYEFLTQQYEQAKLQEAKDTPTVQVLDPAVPPIKRSSPKRKLIVLGWGMLSIFLSCGYIFLAEHGDTFKFQNSILHTKVDIS